MIDMLIYSEKREQGEELERLQTQICTALVGSPAYIKSEIVVSGISDTDLNDGSQMFHLIIGNDNGKDMSIEIPYTVFDVRALFDNTTLVNFSLSKRDKGRQ